MATEVIDLDTLPYYVFKRTDSKRYLEGRYWNCGEPQVAIVAIITQIRDFGDWAAYIGSSSFTTEQLTCCFAADQGRKLTEKDARHFFPEIKLPYRL